MCADDGGDVAAMGHDVLGAADPHLEDAHYRALGYIDISVDDARRDDVGVVAVIAEGRQRGVGLPSRSRAKADVDATGQYATFAK
jgi:hypothetical protein